ncbi:hypothetical protein NRL09_12385 [Aeromonas caviae]|uniref:hypothetical protein n=1 Tax=Aeromonas caviae TaxID=648 RepID=UPI0024CA5658|nr:hypothetical protein NRL03_12380 [Aeromonas caviae]WAF62657.1 hypothetical protein NRL19_12460 [Aeromonas caviae]WAF79496.1 hypothetical protein NRL09_12385 [Aeromonas caviae]
MANVTETPSYDAGIYQIETTDPVLGGPNGIANAQAKGLANRTAFLKQQIDQLNSGQLTPAWIASQDYVQEQLQKLDAKQSVRAATTANITLSGVQTIDGVALTVGDRVLVKDQTAAAQNGIYLVAAQGWTRATDADNGAKLTSAARVAVEAGELNVGSQWYLATTGPITIGVTMLLFKNEHGVATEQLAGLTRLATTQEAASGANVSAVITPPHLQAAKSAAIKDAHRHAVESASGGRNTVLYDAQGNANVMVVIPRFNCEDLGLAAQNLGTGTHPAFIVNGATKPEIFIGKYLASPAPGGCAVVAGAAPYTDIDRPTAMATCKGKGAGWHLMSAHEWGAIQLWCLANGKQPRGNTNYGRAHDAKWETGPRLDGGMPGDVAGKASHYTGKGPASWSHDGTPSGIHDLVGNVWEWLSLLSLVEGRFMLPPDNQFDLAEANWPGIAAYLDSTSSQTTGGNVNVGAMLLAPSVTKRTGPVGNDGYDHPYNYAATIASLAPAAGYASNQLLRRLGIEQCAAAGAIYSRNYGTRAPLRGGGWGDGVDAGLGALYLDPAPSHRGGGVGFRPAFVSP